MASLLYEALLLFGLGLVPGALGALFTALTGHQHPLQGDTALRLYAFGIYAIYFTWFWSARGQTLAMQTWHIRVVTADGGPLSQPRALVRFLAGCGWVLPATLLIALNGWTRWEALAAIGAGAFGYALLAFVRTDRQFWHDAVSGTRLVHAGGGPAASRAAPPKG